MAEYDVLGRDENSRDEEGDGERVAKALARAGVASRREVERLIEAGRVALNGQVLTTPAVKIAAGDILTVDGEVVGEAEPTRLFRYHKPTGLVTSHNDPGGRPTVFASLPPGLPRVISVGRLDLNSEGLLLLTNDGALSRALELPSSDWPRVYRARAYGDATQSKLDRLKTGVTVDGVKYGPIEARLDKARDGAEGRNVWITVTLTEGKNREVRKVLESLGLKVNRLLRLAYGPFVLGDLASGQVEEVGPRVIRELLAGFVSEENMPKGDRPQYVGPLGKTGGRRAPTPPKAAQAAILRAGAKTDPNEPKGKPEYKAGWAKPKAKVNPHAPSKGVASKAGAKRSAALERAKTEGKTFSRPDGAPHPIGRPRAKPEKIASGRRGKVFARAEDLLPGQTPKGLVRAPAAEPVRPAKMANPAKRSPKVHGPRPSRPPEREGGPKREDLSRTEGGFGARSDAPRPPGRGPMGKPGARSEAPRPAGPRLSGPRPSGPRPDGQRPEGPRSSGPRPSRPPERPDAPRGNPADTPYERARREFGDRRPASARPTDDRPKGAPSQTPGPKGGGSRPPGRKGPPRGPKPR